MQSANKSIGGGLIYLPIPKPGQISIHDIALRLSNTCRFNGGTRTPDDKPLFFSTAQHCLEVSHLCVMYAVKFNVDPNEAALAGLAHDFPEYIYGDIISPVKKHLGDSYRAMANEADANVYEGLGITEIMKRCHDIVKWADLEMLISDAARWCCFGEYVIGNQIVKINRWKVVPEPFELRYGQHPALPSGTTYQPLLEAYAKLHKRVFGNTEGT